MVKNDKIITCENIWKLYGKNAQAYLKNINANGQAAQTDFQKIQEDGYIAAIRNVTLDVLQGEKLVIMGLSGSGKSTLVRCLTRLVEITGGKITIEGADLGKLSAKALIELRRSKMGMVFQNFALLPHRTVLENIAFPLQMRGQDTATRRKRALEVIELVGLTGREDYFPRELSGGQQQRVGIARSLAIEPDIWFLDEPFSALDPLIRREMQDEFLRLQAMLGKTILFITHDFDEALRLADRIAIMKDGVIEQINTPAKIVLNPATDYVAKFIEDIDKAKVINAGALWMSKDNILQENKGSNIIFSSDRPLTAGKTIRELGAAIVDDQREFLPLLSENQQQNGWMKRQAALDILFNVKQ